MKLLFDENLSPKLPKLVSEFYPGSIHVRDCGLRSASDFEVWEFARVQEYSIVSKDSDFQEESVLRGSPPRVIIVRIPNAKTAEVASVLISARGRVADFLLGGIETCLILGR